MPVGSCHVLVLLHFDGRPHYCTWLNGFQPFWKLSISQVQGGFIPAAPASPVCLQTLERHGMALRTGTWDPGLSPSFSSSPGMTQAHLTKCSMPRFPGFETGMLLLLPPKGAMLQRWGCAGPSVGHGSPRLPAAWALTPCYLLAVSHTGPQNPPWPPGRSHPSAVGAAAAGNQPRPCSDAGMCRMQDAVLALPTSDRKSTRLNSSH